MPTHIAIVSGNNQTSPVGQAYDQPLAVRVTDQNNLPLGGIPIAFFAPASGASVAFSNNHNYDSAQTNADGIAVSSTLTANDTAGKFSVVAGSIQTSAQVSFSLQNALPSVTTSAPQHDTVVFGQPNSDTVTVTGAEDGPRPTGSVSYFLCGPLQSATGCASGGEDVGSSDLEAATDNAATATSESRPAGSVGTWCYRSSYSGDDSYGGSSDASSNECFTVTPAATSTTLSQKPTSPVAGESVTLSATVAATAPGAGTPTGTVAFTDGGTVLGTAAVDATGTATLDVADLGVGAHTLAATYSGDANFLPSASSKHDYPVHKAASKTTISTEPGAAVFGQAVTLNVRVAAVAPGAGTPTGSVRFTAGTTVLGTATLLGGAASVTTSALAVGSDAITVSYGGDDDFRSSTDKASVTVSPAATATTVSADPAATVFGQQVTLSARVSLVAPGAGALSGTVEFTAGSRSLGTAPVDASGSATMATTALPLGQTQVSARYVGTTDFAASAATTPVTVTVSAADTRTSVSIDPDAAVSGQHVTMTAHVAPVAPASGTPTGTVVFTNGSTTLGSGHLDAAGVATFTTSALPIGPNQITATYPGDANFHPSAANAAVSVDKAATATIVTADPRSGPAGSPIILTAWISVRSPGSGAPTGTVTFTVGTRILGTAAVAPTGLAKLTVTDLPLGTSMITASYSGDAQRAGSRGTTTVSVTAHGGSGGNGGGTSGSLPDTGSQVDSLLGLGVLVLLTGAALGFASWRRSGTRTVKRG
jgi:LPXTG-motif cell wall-anchored protein